MKAGCQKCYGTGFELDSVKAALDLLHEIDLMTKKKKPQHPLRAKIKAALAAVNYRV